MRVDQLCCTACPLVDVAAVPIFHLRVPVWLLCTFLPRGHFLDGAHPDEGDGRGLLGQYVPNALQRAWTKDAGSIAGLNVLRIINEPTAALLNAGSGGVGLLPPPPIVRSFHKCSAHLTNCPK
jgi:hypothetical protein